MGVTALLKRVISKPQNYQNLADPEQSRRLSKDISAMVDQLNSNLEVLEIPTPSGLAGSETSSFATIYWDDVDNDYRDSIDGARIWKAVASSDDNTDFYGNVAKTILVSCSRITRYTDVDVTTGDYVYWVQWINRDGKISPPAGGVTVTIS